MRRLIVTALAAGALLGCASIAPPPGGPEDKLPPQLLSVEPESGAVNVKPDHVTFHFDDVLNEGGTNGLGSFFLISPQNGDVEVGWHRSSLDVHPKHGFRPNTAYTVTMLPGISDLRGNTRKEGARVVFSTGATIPSTEIAGTIFDWVAGTPMASATVQALAQPDTQTVYVAQSDSLGHFELVHVQPGTYLVRGFADPNHDRTLDPHDAWDTAHVAVRDSAHVELLAFQHDTIGPAIASTGLKDSLALQVTFDRGIDPTQPLTPSLFRVQAADSTAVPITRVVSAPEWERARADSLARADSIARADSLKAARDTTHRPDTARVRPPTPPVMQPPVTARGPADTAQKHAGPTPSRPSPITSVILELGQPVQPGKSYRLTTVGLRGLTGASHSTTRVIDVPKTPPPTTPVRDSGKTGAPRGAAPAAPGAKKPPARPPADTSFDRRP